MREIVKILPYIENISSTIKLHVIASQFNGCKETLPILHLIFISSFSRRANITN